jgi:hypothetical protein
MLARTRSAHDVAALAVGVAVAAAGVGDTDAAAVPMGVAEAAGDGLSERAGDTVGAPQEKTRTATINAAATSRRDPKNDGARLSTG